MINSPITGNAEVDYFLYQLYLGHAEATASSAGSSVPADPLVGIPFANRYIHIKYATDNVGTGLSDVPTNKIYWGIYNSNSTTESVNPADYTWYATTGFNTTKFLFYSNLGGRLIKFYAGTTKPSGGTWLIDPGTAIDLDVLIIPITSVNTGDSSVTGLAALLEVLTNSITQSQLFSDLGTRINLIDAAGNVVGSVAYKVAQEATARATAIAAEAATRQANIVTETNNRVAAITGIDVQIATIQADIATLSSTPDYNNATTYAASAIVKYSGGLYRALSTTTGNLPTNTVYWQKIGDYSSLGEAVAAQAFQITDLDTRTTANTTGLTAEATARNTLAATVTSNNNTLTAAVTSEATTRASADSANASNISTTAAIANAKNRSYRQDSEPSAGLVTGDLWFDTDDNNKAYRYSGSAWVITDDTRISANAAAITTETSARVAGETATASSITTINSNISTNSAAISAEATTRSTADTALSNTITALQSTVGTTNAAIVSEATTRATADTALTTSVTALTSTVSTNNTTASNAITSEATTRAAADTALSNSFTALTSTVTTNDTDVKALISAEATTRANADTATTTTATALAATVSANDTTVKGLIVSEATTRGTADTALSNTITSLTATVNADRTTANAAVVAEASARVAGDSAISTTVSTLTSTVAGKIKTYRQASEPNSDMLNGDLWFDSDDNNKAYRFSGIAWIATDDTRIATNGAAITSEATTRAAGDAAISSTVTTLTTNVGNNTTAIQAEASTRTTETGNLFSKYTVKIDTNGYVSGFGLASTANNANPFSEFIIRADKFSVASPSGPGIAPVVPFIVNTTTETINGVSVPPGAYMDAAYIKNGTIVAAKIGNLEVNTLKIKGKAVTIPVSNQYSEQIIRTFIPSALVGSLGLFSSKPDYYQNIDGVDAGTTIYLQTTFSDQTEVFGRGSSNYQLLKYKLVRLHYDINGNLLTNISVTYDGEYVISGNGAVLKTWSVGPGVYNLVSDAIVSSFNSRVFTYVDSTPNEATAPIFAYYINGWGDTSQAVTGILVARCSSFTTFAMAAKR